MNALNRAQQALAKHGRRYLKNRLSSPTDEHFSYENATEYAVSEWPLQNQTPFILYQLLYLSISTLCIRCSLYNEQSRYIADLSLRIEEMMVHTYQPRQIRSYTRDVHWCKVSRLSKSVISFIRTWRVVIVKKRIN